MRWIQKYHADFLNGEGLREVIFLSGCLHQCPGCFNKETWDMDKGNIWTNKDTEELFEELRKPYISGVTFTGGDPFYSLSLGLLQQLCMFRKDENLNFDIWVYTGFSWETLRKKYLEFLFYIDVVCDGPFIKELKANNNKKWVGSSNQRIIDVQKSLQCSQVIEIEDIYK